MQCHVSSDLIWNRRDTSAWVHGALEQMGRLTTEKPGLSQEATGSWPVPVKTVEFPPVTSLLTCYSLSEVTNLELKQSHFLPAVSLWIKEKNTICLRLRTSERHKHPFCNTSRSILWWMWVNLLLLQQMVCNNSLYNFSIWSGLTGICTFVRQHDKNFFLWLPWLSSPNQFSEFQRKNYLCYPKVLSCMWTERIFFLTIFFSMSSVRSWLLGDPLQAQHLSSSVE